MLYMFFSCAPGLNGTGLTFICFFREGVTFIKLEWEEGDLNGREVTFIRLERDHQT